MAQQPLKHPVPSNASLPGSSSPNVGPNAQFLPRKEFLPNHRIASAFSLLTLSGPGLVRLYSFPPQTIGLLRIRLGQTGFLSTVKDDEERKFIEYTLLGKPWASPKRYKTEKLIVEILDTILHCGHSLLSSIDYGREPDDRLAIAFSRPVDKTSLSASLPNGSALSLNQPTRTPFAISFSSTTVVRVIHPPLRYTPGISTAVREAWPRGVVSEKTYDNVIEFKLKGYKWFEEDTFATDSLHQILGLFSALDHHGFTLLCSLSLTGRSRVKDLWIFTGLADDNQTETPQTTHSELKREITPLPHAINVVLPSPLSQTEAQTPSNAKQSNSQVPSSFSKGTSHVRSASDSTALPASKAFPFGKGSSLPLRKVHKRQSRDITTAFVPDSQYPYDPSLFPNVAPNTVPPDKSPSVGSVDMTGIGVAKISAAIPMRSPDGFFTVDGHPDGVSPAIDHHTRFPRVSQSSPYPQFLTPRDRRASADSRPMLSVTQDPSRMRSHSSEGRPYPQPSLLFPSEQIRTSQMPPQTPNGTPPIHSTADRRELGGPSTRKNSESPPSLEPTEGKPRPPEVPRSPTPPLLAPGIFRDSAMTYGTTTRHSSEIPIAWTGKSPEPMARRMLNGHTDRYDERRGGSSQPHSHSNGRHNHDRVSAVNTGPSPPGGWPREEKTRNDPAPQLPPVFATIRERPSQEHEEGGFMGKSKPREVERKGSVSSHSPEKVGPSSHGVRRSEVASVGLVPPTGGTTGAKKYKGTHLRNQVNANGDAEHEKEKERTARPLLANTRRETSSIASGWVMVNVEGHKKSEVGSATDSAKVGGSSSGPTAPRPDHARSASDSRLLTRGKPPQNGGVVQASMSPAAKAIAIIDAQGAKEKEQSSGMFKRLLNRGKGKASGSSSPPTNPVEGGKVVLRRKYPEQLTSRGELGSPKGQRAKKGAKI